MAKIKDTDYLSISSRIRVMETRLLTRERVERMLDARTDDEATKVLSECGYSELPTLTNHSLDSLVAKARGDVYRELMNVVPDKRLIEVFQMKYDYHNAKVLIKANAMGVQADRLLMDCGRWSPEQLRDAFQQEDLSEMCAPFRKAVGQAAEVLNGGGDPQAADFVLDRAYFEEMRAAAQGSGSKFLQGYVQLLIDATNLRSVVRTQRMERGSSFLLEVLIPGGSVDVKALAAGKMNDLCGMFRSGRLAEAAALGADRTAPGSGSLTAFERACDDAVTAYLAESRRIPFGEQPVIGYLYARELELTTIRTILSGRMAGLDGETIRGRLREVYL